MNMSRRAGLLCVLWCACGDPDVGTSRDASDGAASGGDGATNTAPFDVSADLAIPPGATLVEERSGTIDADDQLALDLGGVRLLVPPDPALAGTTVTARHLHGVVKSGPEPLQGLVVQVLPHGLQLTNPAELRWTPGITSDTWTGLAADEGDLAWTVVAATPMGLGDIVVELPHFSLWAISASAGPDPGAITFSGLEDARTATDGGGGLILRVPRASTTATADWFGFADHISYLAYVGPSSGGQNLQRAHAALVDVVADPDATGVTEYRLGGLPPGATSCVIVRARDSEGHEDANTVERCAVAAAADPVAVTLDPVVPSLNAGAVPFLVIDARADRGGVRLDFEKSLDEVAWTPFDAQLSFGGASAYDMPPAGVTVHYRARAWDGDTLVGTSPSVAASLPALDHVVVGPRAVAALPGAAVMRPALYLDGAGHMIFAADPTPGPFAAEPAQSPRVRLSGTHQDLGVGTADPIALWYRIRCGIARFVRPFQTGFGTMAFARGADGGLYVTDGVFGLYRLAATGTACAELVNTSMHTSVHALAAHPTDPLRVAAQDPTGVYTSTDGGRTMTRWVPAGHSLVGMSRDLVLYSALGAVAWSPDGQRLWAALGPALATSVDAGATFSPEAWTSEEWIAAIAVRADGVAAAWSGRTHSSEAFALGPSGALAIETLPGYPSAGIRELLWLADGRLLAFTDDRTGIQGASRYLAIRAPAGGWTESRVASPRDVDSLHVDPVDRDVIYAGLLRSDDRGASWTKMRAGYARGATTLDGVTTRLLVVAGEPSGGGSSTMLVSTDRGDSGTPATGVLSSLLTFDPEAPARGLARGGAYTTDGGATWDYGEDIDAENMDLVGWATTTRAYASSDAAGAGFFFVTEDGGASWSDLNEDRPSRLVPRFTTGNGRIATAIGIDAQGPFLIADAGSGWSKIAPPAALVAGGGQLGNLAFARHADLDSGVVFAVVVPAGDPMGPEQGCRGALWRSTGGLAGPWVELHPAWSAAGWLFDCRIRVDGFDADPDVMATPVAR